MASIDFGSYSAAHAFNGANIAIVPYSLIGLVRSGLTTQGADPLIVRDDGSLDYERLIGMAFDTVEIRTTVTPPWRIDLKPGAPPPPGAPPQVPMVASLKPAAILSGRFGRAVIAPYGLPEGGSAIATGAKVAGALIAALVVWKLV